MGVYPLGSYHLTSFFSFKGDPYPVDHLVNKPLTMVINHSKNISKLIEVVVDVILASIYD